jgi:truncated hemoglobin YjbI
MRTLNLTQKQALFAKIGGETVIKQIIDIFYSYLLDDYRINRFFNTEDESQQKMALTTLIIATYQKTDYACDEFKQLLDHFFMLAFSRRKRKSFVTGSDFSFLGSLIAQDHPETHLLCDAHASLLKFMPEDSHYDTVIEQLNASLQQFNIDNMLIKEILAMAENARNYVLGRQSL